jgi:hypothetical protein
VALERIVPRPGATVLCLWIGSGAGAGDVVDLLERELDVDAVRIDTVDDWSLIRLHWDLSAGVPVVRRVTDSDVSITAVGTVGGWRLRLRSDDHETITEL